MLTGRHYLPLLCAVLAAGALRAQTPDATTPAETPPPAKPKTAVLENELAMYSPFESPWADLKADHAVETHVFNLLRAEVRLWALQNQLAGQDGPARENAEEVTRIIHGQVLAEVAEALPLLEKAPNRPFAQLLVHQLEAYPYEWKEEGSEDLLPRLHKLVDPPQASPRPDNGVRRHRRKATGDDNG